MDENEGRRGEAYDLCQTFERQLSILRSRAPLVVSSPSTDSDDVFLYPGALDGQDESANSEADGASVSTSLRSGSIYSASLSPRLLSPARRSASYTGGSGSGSASQAALSPPPTAAMSSSRPTLVSLSQHLSSNPDFRVPTNETPSSSTALATGPAAVASAHIPALAGASEPPNGSTIRSIKAEWEADERALDCRRCHRKFTVSERFRTSACGG